MLRDQNLVPLSRQHQHALALCVRIDRASPIGDLEIGVWQAEIAQHFQNEIRIHFAAEEHVLFPAARRFPALNALIDELLSDHFVLREAFAKAEAHTMTASELKTFAEQMSVHVRKEERLLFERMQELMTQEALAAVGGRLAEALKESSEACVLRSEAARVRPSKERLPP